MRILRNALLIIGWPIWYFGGIALIAAAWFAGFLVLAGLVWLLVRISGLDATGVVFLGALVIGAVLLMWDALDKGGTPNHVRVAQRERWRQQDDD